MMYLESTGYATPNGKKPDKDTRIANYRSDLRRVEDNLRDICDCLNKLDEVGKGLGFHPDLEQHHEEVYNLAEKVHDHQVETYTNKIPEHEMAEKVEEAKKKIGKLPTYEGIVGARKVEKYK